MIGQAVDHESSHTTMLQKTGGRAEAITVAQIVELSESGEPVAQAIVNDALDALSLALAHAVTLLAPDTIVIGGPFALIGEPFLMPLRARVQKLCQPVTRVPELVGAALEPRAAMIGAYLLAEAITTSLG
jgi:glucokinase